MKPIYVACPNLSLDRTMRVDDIVVGRVHRSLEADVRGGGKGVNVARALSCLGARAPVAGMIAGSTGSAVRELLRDEGIDLMTTSVAGQTRSCLTVLDGIDITVFNEAGPRIDDAAWRRYRAAVERWLPADSLFVCSGSWPPGSPSTAAAELIRLAKVRDCTTICDTSRSQLAPALAANPYLIKPNLDEALALLNGSEHERVDPGPSLRPARSAATALLARGPEAVVVTAGGSGAILATAQTVARVPALDVDVVNPVGAGDSMVAGIAEALARGEDLEAAVAWGSAVAAASCETFAAGQLSRKRAEDLYASSSAI